MKIKMCILLFTITLFSCGDTKTSDNSFNSKFESIETSLIRTNNEVIQYYYYSNFYQIPENLLDTVTWVNYSFKYIDKDIIPDFILCGDYVSINYYGEIIYLPAEESNNYAVSEWYIEGNIESYKYIQAEVKQVEFITITHDDGSAYFEVDNTKFEFIVLDKEYHFCPVNDFDINQELYASYYEGVPQAIYSFNPLI